YLDGYRSFLEAERRDADLVMAYVGEVISILLIGNDPSSHFIARTAIDKIRDRAKRIPLTPAEQAWTDFAISYEDAAKPTSVRADRRVKPLREAVTQIQKNDPKNYDGHGLVVWLAYLQFDKSEVKKIYRNILQHQPDSITAHHVLLHIAETEDDSKEARLQG